MPFPRFRRARWLLAGGAAVLVAAVAVALVLLLHSPGNESHPAVEFTAPTSSTTTTTTPAPKRSAGPPFAWPRYGYSAARTRNFAGGIHPPFRVGWRFQDFALLEFPPVILGHTLYLDDDDASAKAIDARTGHKLWEHKLGTLAAASPAIGVAQGLMYVPILSRTHHSQVPGDGAIVALSLHDGRVRWSHTIPAGTESSPLAYGDAVYFGDQSGTVYSLNAATGHVNWTFHASDAVKGGPAYADGRIFFGDYSGRAYALDALTGRRVWVDTTSGSAFGFASGNFYSTPAVAFGRVYMGNTDGRVYSFAERNGQLAWATGTSAYVYASAAVADPPGIGPTVYLGSYDGNFYAFDARTGSIRWTHHAGGRISGSPTIVGNIIYYSDLGHHTTAGLDLRNGHRVFFYPDGAFNPVVADPHTIYMSGYSMLYQLLPRGR